jgi:hypothetical protein
LITHTLGALPASPTRMTLDISGVLESTYFFI